MTLATLFITVKLLWNDRSCIKRCRSFSHTHIRVSTGLFWFILTFTVKTTAVMWSGHLILFILSSYVNYHPALNCYIWRNQHLSIINTNIMNLPKAALNVLWWIKATRLDLQINIWLSSQILTQMSYVLSIKMKFQRLLCFLKMVNDGKCC